MVVDLVGENEQLVLVSESAESDPLRERVGVPGGVLGGGNYVENCGRVGRVGRVMGGGEEAVERGYIDAAGIRGGRRGGGGGGGGGRRRRNRYQRNRYHGRGLTHRAPRPEYLRRQKVGRRLQEHQRSLSRPFESPDHRGREEDRGEEVERVGDARGDEEVAGIRRAARDSARQGVSCALR